jgi:hypothetical protein
MIKFTGPAKKGESMQATVKRHLLIPIFIITIQTDALIPILVSTHKVSMARKWSAGRPHKQI